MRGEATCHAAPDDNAEGTSCCIHLRPRKRDYVCCWCGSLFMAEDGEHAGARHGQYHRKRCR